MANININIERGGLGRQSANVDTWAGIFVRVDALPTNWTANEVKRIFKPEDLEPFAITANSVNLHYRLVYWHISEIFRLAPNSTIYLQLGLDVDGGTDNDTIFNAFVAFEDRLRLFGIVQSQIELDAAAVNAVQTELDSIFDEEKLSVRCVATFKKDATDLIPDFSSGTANRVMVDISTDLTPGSLGKTLFDGTIGMSGGCGTILGQLLLLSVHQRPSWRSFSINASGIWEVLGDINGDSVEDKTLTEINAYDTQGLVLMTRTPRLPDAFVSSARMAVVTSDDYAVITHGRVIDKAISLAYDGLVRSLDGPVYVNPDTGRIVPETIAALTRNAYDAINNNMVIGLAGNAVEVGVDPATGSLPLDAIYINPDQEVLQTENIDVQIRIVPVGASRTITINIGLTVPQ